VVLPTPPFWFETAMILPIVGENYRLAVPAMGSVS
jgi:hypothetical protein